MRYRIFMILSAALTAGLVAAALLKASPGAIVALGAGSLLALILGLRAVVRPLNAVQNGLYLLKSQDFSSRLRLTGQEDADRVVELFNRLMATMKSERLRLMEQNLFLAKLIEVSPMGIAVCDFDGRVVETNPVYRRLQSQALDEVLGSLAPGETRMLRQASSQIYRCSRLWFMDSGFRRTFYLIEILTDDIIRSERNIFHTIVRTIGHEVGNTLGAVKSVLGSLAEIHASDEVVAAAVRGSLESCDNLLAFVRGYAEVVKLPTPKCVLVNPAEEIQRMMPVLRSIAGDDIAIELIVGSKEQRVNLDMMLIERAIINIVKNSVESIGASPGRIVIEVDGAQLRITDTGAGISDENAVKLFTPFFSTKRPDRGLGLMLISEILRSQGADFSLRTDRNSATTTFEIRF